MTDSQEDQKLKDAKELHRFGYAQELLREMGGFANFAVSFTVISILTGVITLYGQSITFGGPAVNGIGWPIAVVFSLAVAASMAEIASAIPTAGAMYHWSSLLGGPGWGWFTAWFNLVGQVATTAGIDYGLALFIVQLLGWDSPHALILLYAALLISHGLFNHYGIRVVAFLNDFSVWYHIAGTFLVIGAFWFFAPRRPVSFAFMTGFTTSKYPYYWAFMIGLLEALWTFTGYDASAHVTEETVDPRKNAPWGMINAVLLSGIFGYLLVIAITLAIQDLPAAAAAPNPFIYIAEHALGPRLGTALVWSILPAMWFCGLSMVTTNARMIFAFSRDGGLPLSKTWVRVNHKHRTPTSAIWLSVTLAFLIALYSKAFVVIVSLSTIGMYVSYIIPVFLCLLARRKGKWNELGPWNLGRWGATINAIAVVWVVFVTILFVIPPNELTGYTFAGLFALLTIYYFAWVRGRFKGPQRAGSEKELAAIEHGLEGPQLSGA